MGFMVVDLGEPCSRMWRGSRVANSGQWIPRCAGCSGALTRPGAEGAAHRYLLLDQYAPLPAALERGLWSGVDDVSASERLTIWEISAKAQADGAFAQL